MATTSPDNIKSPDAGDQYALVQDLGALADTVQNALTRRANAYTGTSAQRTAFTSAPQGAIWVDTNGSRALYTREGSAWVRFPISRGGSISGVSLAANTVADVEVTYPPGSFASAPRVVLSPNNPVAWDPITFRVLTRSVNGFTAQFRSPVARTGVAFDWVASSE